VANVPGAVLAAIAPKAVEVANKEGVVQIEAAITPGAVEVANKEGVVQVQAAIAPGAVEVANKEGVVQIEAAITPGAVEVANKEGVVQVQAAIAPGAVEVANKEGVVQVAPNVKADVSAHFNFNQAVVDTIHLLCNYCGGYGLLFAVGYALVTKPAGDMETGKVRLIDVVLGLFLIVSLVSIFRLYQYINKRHEQADSDVCRMFSAMQQTIQGPNPPAWFVRLISVNTADIKQSYEVPLWIRGANIIRNNLTWGQATVEMDGTEAFLRLPGIHPSRIPLKHGAVSCKPFSSNANWYLIATVTAWPVVPEF